MDCEADIVSCFVELLTEESLSELLSLFHAEKCSRGRMKMADFMELMGGMMKVSPLDERLSALCRKVDIENDGYVTENKLMSYLLLQLREREAFRTVKPLPFQDLPDFKHNLYSKQCPCRLLHLFPPSRYLSISRDGIITTWSSSLQLLRGTVMDDKATMIDRNDLLRMKRTNLWVTDATVLLAQNILIISTTSRELNFYDVSSTVYKFLYRLCDLPAVPLCIVSHVNDDNSALMLYGDTKGNVTVFHFLYPSIALFAVNAQDNPSASDKIHLILYSRLPNHSQFVQVTVVAKVHQEWIQRIMYLPQNHSIITCSIASQNSLVMRDIDGRRKSYIFNLMKGITCFDFSFDMNLLVTGSPDHGVRFWDPYVPTSPVSTRMEHLAPVLDVLIHKDMKLVYTFSRDLVLCVWDIYEFTLYQNINVKFPFSQRQPDFSTTILTLTSPSQLTVMCNEYIAVFSVGNLNNNLNKCTHSSSVVSVLFESKFNYVLTGSKDGEVIVWDCLTGTKVRSMRRTHDDTELTFMSLDGNESRLITGSREGEIKIWNHMNGECLHVMLCSGSTEVTGVVHLPDRALFLSAGWNKRIVSFNDKSDVFKVKQDSNAWTNFPHHSDDILSVSFSQPHYLATGSFDGDIIIWNTDTTLQIVQFKSLTQIRAAINLKLHKQRSSHTCSRSEISHTPSRSSSRLSSHRLKSTSNQFDHVPVDKVLFLKTRIHQRQTHGVLVTSEAGNGRFWSFPGRKEPQGSFPLTISDDELVLALATDPNDNYLLAGDTMGFISVFDISHYCIGESANVMPLTSASWTAHAGEITNIEYHHSATSFVLSSSYDCNVKLWTFKGELIGTFGQKNQWNILESNTYQHYQNTQAEEYQEMNLIKAKATTAPLQQDKEEGEESASANSAKEDNVPHLPEQSSTGSSSLTSSTASITKLSQFDNKLADRYNNKATQRMTDKQDRRQCYADIDIHSTEKFGLLCSPFQALQLVDIADPVVPGSVAEFLHDSK